MKQSTEISYIIAAKLSLPHKPSVEVGQEEQWDPTDHQRPIMETTTEFLAVLWGQGQAEVASTSLPRTSHQTDSAEVKQGSFHARMGLYQSCLYLIVFHFTFSRHTKNLWLN